MQEAICILGGGIKKDVKGMWHTLDFGGEGDDFGETCDRWRIVTASLLWKKNPKNIIIVSGNGKQGQLVKFPDAPTVAEVIRKELIELGVPLRRIVKEEKSNSTYGQLFFLSYILEEKKIEKVYIISNEWHLERIQAFMDKGPGLKEMWNPFEVKLLSAEGILLSSDKNKWENVIRFARESEGIKKRILLEKKGVEEIRRGTYVYKK